MKVTVIGGGLYGLSTAWGLARAGHSVSVLEQAAAIPNPVGSSVDQHRLIRAPYGPFDGYARLIPAALRAWDLLWTDLGETHFVETGTLVISDAKAGWARAAAEGLARVGRKVDWLDGKALSQRFPLLTSEGADHAFYLPDGGVLLAERIVASLGRHLRARGVAIGTGARVAAIEPERARAILADGSRIDADALVVAAGCWVAKLLPEMAKRVTPSRQVALYVEPPAEQAQAWQRAPMILEKQDTGGFYLVPAVAGMGLKVGDHHFSMNGGPDDDRTPTAGDGAEVPKYCRIRIRDFDRFKITERRVCFYTVSADERFIVEPLTERSLVVSACSGHGFKFGAVMGLEIAKALGDPAATAGLTRLAAGRLD